MDDFGNDYQDDAWFYGCDQFSASMSTYGFADDVMHSLCIQHSIDYAAQVL